jgi:hypothetical protein
LVGQNFYIFLQFTILILGTKVAKSVLEKLHIIHRSTSNDTYDKNAWR